MKMRPQELGYCSGIENYSRYLDGREIIDSYYKQVSTPVEIGVHDIYRLEGHELMWYYSGEYFIFTQEYPIGVANGENPITEWLLETYPPVDNFGSCSIDQIYNPYKDICEGAREVCGFEGDERHCSLIEGQTGIVEEYDLEFTLISAYEGSEDDVDSVVISVDGEYIGLNTGIPQSYDFFDDGSIFRSITFESVDGDSDKILGAGFDIIEGGIL